MKKRGFVYLWTNTDNGMMYLGSHYGFPDDGYISSSKHFNEEYEKVPEKFVRTILYDGLSMSKALEIERKELYSVDAMRNPLYYNLHNESGSGWSHHDDPELSRIYYAKISKAKKGKPSPLIGTKQPQSVIDQLCDRWLVECPDGSVQEIKNMRKYCIENMLNPSAMSAVARGNRQHHKGYKCRKISNNRAVNYEYSEWQSRGQRGGPPKFGSENPFAKSISVYGKKYGSMIEASKATGLSMYKLRKLRTRNE